MQKLGKKQLVVELKEPASGLPDTLSDYAIELSNDGSVLTYTYDTGADATGITQMLQLISEAGLSLKDIQTKQSSLEDIFVDLVKTTKPQQVTDNSSGGPQ
jgi:ABC-2 type transport system ATP-binding protein